MDDVIVNNILERDRAIYALPLLVALILTGLISQFRVPHQLIAMFMGGVIGSVIFNVPRFNGLVIHFWTPSSILYAVHPIMILKLTYGMDRYMLVNSLSQILVICTVGVLSFTFAFGTFINMMMPFNELRFVNCVASGLTLAAIDVPDILLELHQIKNLQMLMDTESILSTALCLIMYEVVLGIYMDILNQWYHYVFIFIRYIGLSALIGYITGKVSTLFITHIFDDNLNIVTMIIGVSYLLYIICETAIACTGCIAVFVSVYQISQGMSKLSYEVDKSVRRFVDGTYNAIEMMNSIALSSTVIYFIMKIYKGFDIAIALAVYVLGNVLRFIIFLLLSPILSRLGFGFEFATMFTIIWGSKRGSMQLLQVLCLYYDDIIDILGSEILCFSLVFLFLTFLINMTTIKMILAKFKLLELSQSRKNNIIYCFKLIKQNSHRLISTLKKNRFYTDANWVVINEAMKLTNPFGSTEETSDEVLLESGNRDMYCPVCKRNVCVDPTKKEIFDLTRDAKLRVLKAKRISYMKQYENGLLDKEEMNVLLQAVEIAMLSQDLEIDVEHFLEIFRKKTMLVKIQNMLKKLTTQSTGTIPLDKFKRRLYLVVTNKWFDVYLYTVIIIDVCNTLHQLADKDYVDYYYLFHIIECLSASSYVFHFFANLVAFSEKPWGKYLKTYFKNFWVCVEFITMVASVVDAGLGLGARIRSITFTEGTFYGTKAFTLLRLLMLLKILQFIQPKVSRLLEKKIDESTLAKYTIGKALMVGFDDVLDNFSQILENEIIRDRLRDKINSDKIIIGMEVGSMEKESPGIMTTIKTRHAIKACLKTMERGVNELKLSGFVDDYEYHKLCVSLQEPWKYVDRWIKPILPKQIFFEMAWLMDDDITANFLYDNITNKVWEAGEVICETGQPFEGIYILISGLFKVIYKPTSETLDHLFSKGELPVKEFLTSRLLEHQIEYVMVGNTVGELGIITGRPSSCTIISDLPSQAFIIPSDVMYEALQTSTDPIKGLEGRLWKCLSTNLVRKILERSPVYATITSDHMDAILDRGIIPNISSYKILTLNEYIEDVVLVEGVILDFNTREVYTAPCYIPRTVTSIVMPSSSNMNMKTSVDTKLFMIPVKGVNEYNIMFMIQSVSILKTNPPSKTIISESTVLKSKKMKGNINSARLKSAIKRLTNTSMSIESKNESKSTVQHLTLNMNEK